MCELLGMTARYPTDINSSLALLRPRGGEIGPHGDGWGVAFYEGRASRIFKEPISAAHSRCLALITENDYRSSVVIGHIRRANPPEYGRTSANTHPFSRELFGRSWVFAHNGKLPAVKDDARFALGRFHPIGDTDSEHTFCYLLDRIAAGSDAGVGSKDVLDLRKVVSAVRSSVDAMSELGELNFLLSDGAHLLAFANTKLHRVIRSCVERECDQRVTLLATTALTDENWASVELGRIHVYADGSEIDV